MSAMDLWISSTSLDIRSAVLKSWCNSEWSSVISILWLWMVVITCCSDIFDGAEVILMSILAGYRLLWVLGLLYQVESAAAAEHF